MRRPALDMHLEAADALAAGHDLAAVAGGLGDEREGGVAGEVLDHRPRRRAADLLVGRHQVDERPPGAAGAGDRLEGLERQIRPALHVVAARAIEPVALEPHRQIVIGGAERVHGVEMRHDEHGGLARLRPRPQHQHVAEPGPARDALDRDRRVRDLGRDEVHHPVDAGRRVRRALGAQPGRQVLEGIAVRAHRRAVSVRRRSTPGAAQKETAGLASPRLRGEADSGGSPSG